MTYCIMKKNGYDSYVWDCVEKNTYKVFKHTTYD